MNHPHTILIEGLPHGDKTVTFTGLTTYGSSVVVTYRIPDGELFKQVHYFWAHFMKELNPDFSSQAERMTL